MDSIGMRDQLPTPYSQARTYKASIGELRRFLTRCGDSQSMNIDTVHHLMDSKTARQHEPRRVIIQLGFMASAIHVIIPT